jgi:hypothetical protein
MIRGRLRSLAAFGAGNQYRAASDTGGVQLIFHRNAGLNRF